MTKQWYVDVGFEKEGKFKMDPWDQEPDYCSDASKGYTTNRCGCPGTLYYGVKTDPVSKSPIESLEKLK